MVLRNITNEGDPFVDGSGNPLAGVRIEFYLMNARHLRTDAWDVVSGELIAAGPIHIFTDNNGEFTIPLWPTSRGDQVLYWYCHVDYDGSVDFFAPLVDGVGPVQWIDFKFGGVPPSPLQYDVLTAHIADANLHFNWRGAYVHGTEYLHFDAAQFAGSTWKAKVDNINIDPPTDPAATSATWALMAAKGDVGPVGPASVEAILYSNLRALSVAGLVPGTQKLVAGRTTAGDGGGGVFRWDSSNLSVQVTADPLSGIYVAPTSASTGASGAWVRIDWDRNVKAFGATGDGVTDDTAAFKYAIAASTDVYVPPGEYYITETLNIKSCLNLHGANGNQVSGFSSVIKFKAGIVGIFIHRHNTNASTTGVPVIVTSGGAGDGTILSRLKIQSVGGVADAASHGVWSKARFRISNCFVTGFQGDGVHVYASTSGSDPYTLGNANNWHIDNLATYSNGGHGLYVVGSDVNAGVATLIDSSFNVDGIKDSSFLGNTYLACHTSANTGIPYNITGASAKCVLVGCYQEGGQSASVINTRSICIGGTNSFPQSINADAGSITFSSGVLVQGGDGTVSCKVNEGTGVALGMYNTLNPNGFKFRYSAAGADLYFGYANSSPGIAMTVTGPNTTELFGRSVTQPYKITGNFMVGTTSPRARDTRTAAPTTGEWARGDIVYNASPSAGGFVGWVCVVAGTPGTWKTFGDITA